MFHKEARIFSDTGFRFQSSRYPARLIKEARIFSDTGSNTCKVLKITFGGNIFIYRAHRAYRQDR